jgi:hypothetical protein
MKINREMVDELQSIVNEMHLICEAQQEYIKQLIIDKKAALSLYNNEVERAQDLDQEMREYKYRWDIAKEKVLHFEALYEQEKKKSWWTKLWE